MLSKVGWDLLSQWISNNRQLSWSPTMVLSSESAHRSPVGETMTETLILSSQHTFIHGVKEKDSSWVMIPIKIFTTCTLSKLTQQFLVDGSSCTQPTTLISIRSISLSKITILLNGLKLGVITLSLRIQWRKGSFSFLLVHKMCLRARKWTAMFKMQRLLICPLLSTIKPKQI